MLIENRGDMGARAEGARAATGEIVLFIDDDVLANPGLVTGHARRHAERACLDVVCWVTCRSRHRSAGTRTTSRCACTQASMRVVAS